MGGKQRRETRKMKKKDSPADDLLNPAKHFIFLFPFIFTGALTEKLRNEEEHNKKNQVTTCRLEKKL